MNASANEYDNIHDQFFNLLDLFLWVGQRLV